MITKAEIQTLLHSTETYRIERTISTGNMDKFCEAICAFANDLPDCLYQFDVSKLTVFCVNVYSNEDRVSQVTTQKTTQTVGSALSDIQLAIIEYIQSHPNASRKEIAANLNNITENGVKYHMQKLQKQGIIKRIGADFGGYWEITVPKE